MRESTQEDTGEKASLYRPGRSGTFILTPEPRHYSAFNWKARAVHNKYVLQLEESAARTLIEKDFDAYEEYVAQVLSGSCTVVRKRVGARTK
jgi:hypothetical protein